MKVAINGFGRIGRLVYRHIMEQQGDVELVAINDIADLRNLAYLLRHDTVQPSPTEDIRAEDGSLLFGDRRVRYLSERDPASLPWSDLGVQLVIEASGLFTDREGASKHLHAGAERVLITAPGKGADLTVCVGVNDEQLDPDRHRIVSNASCTTNCLAPVAKVLDERFGIVSGLLTTVHAVTSSQALVDAPSKKWRRGRAAMGSIVPTTTGAAKATTEVLPQLAGKMDGMAVRVPVLAGSIIDFVARVERKTDREAVNQAFREAAGQQRLRGILGVSDEELVSADIIGSSWSALVDAPSTAVVGGDLVKVLAWYDNEWAYARRVVDLASLMTRGRR